MGLIQQEVQISLVIIYLWVISGGKEMEYPLPQLFLNLDTSWILT